MQEERQKYPFEVAFSVVQADPDGFIDIIFASLESEFLVLPKGSAFLEYDAFERAYEALKRATSGFRDVQVAPVMAAAQATPVIIIVLRVMLGFSPPEWAYIASQRSGLQVSQGFVRSLDRRIRANPQSPLRGSAATMNRVSCLVETACGLLSSTIPEEGPGRLHRLDKADTRHGLESVRALAGMGAPYAMLLYERYLGRPFASHRDSVSELVGGVLESAIEDELSARGISYRKTKRAERIAGFDQAPDFVIPSEYSPAIVIEAKVTEDDGTARDKVTRVQHLAEVSATQGEPGSPAFDVIACIAGRGFGVRREDMRKLLFATRGYVFTAKTLEHLVEHTRLREFKSM